ncbi:MULTISPECIES: hypothetical protein [Mycobacterium]|uniref:Uncharacterized protein n=1 Tax=Mycobacterium kiyosense TaxID=2871094 RepID=A0A9P3V0Q2_9MYCO|nr:MULTISPECIES: hypothetical protein [Mycobacterium]BDB44744.1 hypothetical protein IWGMT90018_51900 [Mycobacterium kiyosense]BDE16240.1 hypothetical protein MKCMC460_51000 [Mycobacterium sp. 20KCMC460]GLB86064.1 hypothetical protein SRL2020028_53200 [Mycobacterium kiyosense]GLB92773.1 hypothetical protein SRL2020130_55900 [Mycobacterium kiyosense]GLB98688.1 hypothetical protein SRL2020226_54640 [Mycobacterium kiyosense]
MSVAGFVLGLVATVLAVASLGWQIGTFLRQRPRPRLTAVIGRLTPDGLLTNDASADVRECLSNAAEQFDDLVIGVKVVNAGRAPFHVDGWAIRSDPDGTSLVPIGKPVAGADVPHEIPPAGSAVFLTELAHAHHFSDVAAGVADQRLVLTVSSGARTYATKPIATELFSAG